MNRDNKKCVFTAFDFSNLTNNGLFSFFVKKGLGYKEIKQTQFALPEGKEVADLKEGEELTVWHCLEEKEVNIKITHCWAKAEDVGVFIPQNDTKTFKFLCVQMENEFFICRTLMPGCDHEQPKTTIGI